MNVKIIKKLFWLNAKIENSDGSMQLWVGIVLIDIISFLHYTGVCRSATDSILGNKCKERHKCRASFHDYGRRNKEDYGSHYGSLR